MLCFPMSKNLCTNIFFVKPHIIVTFDISFVLKCNYYLNVTQMLPHKLMKPKIRKNYFHISVPLNFNLTYKLKSLSSSVSVLTSVLFFQNPEITPLPSMIKFNVNVFMASKRKSLAQVNKSYLFSHFQTSLFDIIPPHFKRLFLTFFCEVKVLL